MTPRVRNPFKKGSSLNVKRSKFFLLEKGGKNEYRKIASPENLFIHFKFLYGDMLLDSPFPSALSSF